MSRQQITANGFLDLLTKQELQEAMGHSMDAAVRDFYRGVDYLMFAGTGGATPSNTFTIPNSPDSGYTWSLKLVAAQLNAPPATSPNTPNTPTFPASGVAVQNTNPYPVSVLILGGTLTAVVVNGITVGTTAGTYLVPVAGAISITYSVAPSWVWTQQSTPPVPVLSVYPASAANVAPIKSTIAIANGSQYEAFMTWSSEQVVIKDGRSITLFSSASTINNYLLCVKQVPTEMQGKLQQ